MEKWFCIWNDLANPKNWLNLIPNPLITMVFTKFKIRKKTSLNLECFEGLPKKNIKYMGFTKSQL